MDEHVCVYASDGLIGASPCQVIRGVRLMRPGLVENSRQFEFCHKVLEQVLWGKVAKEMARAVEHKGTSKGKRKWWQFKKKGSGTKGGGLT